MSELLEELRALAVEERELVHTALHEAGHAVWGLRHGIEVVHLTIRPTSDSLGHVEFTRPEPSTLEDCAPDSLWARKLLLFGLAGDRAVRLLDPHEDTSGGAARSDYAKASEVLHVLSGGADGVDDRLEGLCREVDQWFQRADVQDDLLTVSRLLLERGGVSGQEMREALSDGLCGAVHEGEYLVCRQRAHSVGPHLAYTFPDPLIPSQEQRMPVATWETWPTRGPVSKRLKPTPRIRRVLAALDGTPLTPPRKRDFTEAEAVDYRRRLALGQTTPAEQTKYARYMAKRNRVNQITPLLPPSGSPPAEHDCEGWGELIKGPNSYMFCSSCGFEQGRPPAGTLYQLVRLAEEAPDADKWLVVPVDNEVLPTAAAAAPRLRIQRAHGHDWGLIVRQVRLVPPARAKQAP